MKPYHGPNPIGFYLDHSGLTQEQIALQCGMTKEYLAALASGEERRGTVRLLPLAAFFGIPVEELVAA